MGIEKNQRRTLWSHNIKLLTVFIKEFSMDEQGDMIFVWIHQESWLMHGHHLTPKDIEFLVTSPWRNTAVTAHCRLTWTTFFLVASNDEHSLPWIIFMVPSYVHLFPYDKTLRNLLESWNSQLKFPDLPVLGLCIFFVSANPNVPMIPYDPMSDSSTETPSFRRL